MEKHYSPYTELRFRGSSVLVLRHCVLQKNSNTQSHVLKNQIQYSCKTLSFTLEMKLWWEKYEDILLLAHFSISKFKVKSLNQITCPAPARSVLSTSQSIKIYSVQKQTTPVVWYKMLFRDRLQACPLDTLSVTYELRIHYSLMIKFTLKRNLTVVF